MFRDKSILPGEGSRRERGPQLLFMKTPRSITSLRNDLQEFIIPLARSLREGNGNAAVGNGTTSSCVLGGCGQGAAVCGDANDPSAPQRSPGVRRAVTYFTPQVNALLNRPLVTEGVIKCNVPLYQCPICSQSGDVSANVKHCKQPWMTPQDLTRHMSWLHASNGYTQSNFAAYNTREMERLCNALPSSAAAPAAEEVAMKPRVVLMVDVANVELSLEDVLFQLLSAEESITFFSRVACTFVCVHEFFIPHTSRPGHVFFQLSRLNDLSDTFTFYAATRIESGDFVTAALIGELLLRDMRGCAPSIVLLTRDQQQRVCVGDMFSGVAGRGARVFLPRMTSQGIMNCLREANLSSMGL
uniref:Uncharacterized protein TCIL3000_7_450 n=1 Tax=Trypanosoma congolense (strain IL3000) TaxID=1068625 RepID=G0UPD5_TRYCI|nr:unnamed protein product [Trypanosoma congolense IL3000]